jgi:hypothetical protein
MLLELRFGGPEVVVGREQRRAEKGTDSGRREGKCVCVCFVVV